MGDVYKVIFLGDTGVGKTSVISRRVQGTFDFKMVPTVGAGYEVTEVEVDGQTVELRCWDTAGQEQYSTLMPLYLRGAQVAVIVASIVDHISISHLEKWKSAVEENGPGTQVIVLINKIDLQGGSATLDDLRAKLLDEFGTVLFASARAGEGIDDLFYSIATAAIQGAKTRKDAGDVVDPAQASQPQTGKKCC